VNSFVTVIARGAELECSRTSLGLPRPTTPRPRHGCAAPSHDQQSGASQKLFSNNNEPERLAGRAARSTVAEKRAV
jgi:hypothetical protein